jgi:Ca2+-binding RTX toxin-like protein
VLGGDGNDQLKMTNPVNMKADGGAGDDQIEASGAQLALLLSGGDGNDSLFVQSGTSATLIGGGGNDWLGTNGTSHVLEAALSKYSISVIW